MRISDWSADVCSSDLVATVDDAPAEAALALGMLVEVHARRVLVEARRHLMLRLLDGHGVAVVDPLARFVIGPAMRRAGRREVEVGEVEARRDRKSVG